MSPLFSRIPILLLDVEGYSKQDERKRALLVRRLRNLLDDAGWQLAANHADDLNQDDWKYHGTGDGYYVFLNGLSPARALSLALFLRQGLQSHQEQMGLILSLRVRAVLVVGDVTQVRDQYQGEALVEGARLLDHPPFKIFLADQPSPLALAVSGQFYHLWQAEPGKQPEELMLSWSQFSFRDKQSMVREGYLLGGVLPDMGRESLGQEGAGPVLIQEINSLKA